jgi:SAM-dependent methyltransferase
VKLRLLDWLACPGCRGALVVAGGAPPGDELREGQLACGGCGAVYPVVRGIPRLLPADLASEAVATAARFGYEWTRFAEIRPEYEEQFRGWIAPVETSEFKDRLVVDAGCGKGRHLRLAAAFGAREVIGVDLGPAVEVAARNTADLDNVHVVQGDLTRPPLRPGVAGLIYSIGVLHHLGEPAAGFRGLAGLLGPEGKLVAWLYAREGNGWVLALVDPTRRVTRRLPLPLVSGLAWALTVPLWAAVRLLYGPARSRPGLGRWLPYRSYLSDLAPFPFREMHSIAFDQLLAPVAHYMPRADVERCFAAGGLALRSLRWHHANSWAAGGVPDPTRAAP